MTPARKRANKKWARLNPKYFAVWKLKQHHKRMKFIRLLKQKSCADCGDWLNSWQMDFDHRDMQEKKCDVSDLYSCTWKRLLEEIKKCDLVCANCHRDRTYRRNQNDI